MQSLAKLYMIVLAALLLLATVPNGSLLAASPGATEKTTPQGEDAPGPDNGTAVPPSAENKGVITPPPIGDTGIHAHRRKSSRHQEPLGAIPTCNRASRLRLNI